MGIVITIIVGGFIGWLASLFGKTSNQMGCIWNVVIGIAGASVGHWLATRLFDGLEFERFSMKGMLVSLAGALILVLLLRGLGILRKNQ